MIVFIMLFMSFKIIKILLNFVIKTLKRPHINTTALIKVIKMFKTVFTLLSIFVIQIKNIMTDDKYIKLNVNKRC